MFSLRGHGAQLLRLQKSCFDSTSFDGKILQKLSEQVECKQRSSQVLFDNPKRHLKLDVFGFFTSFLEFGLCRKDNASHQLGLRHLSLLVLLEKNLSKVRFTSNPLKMISNIASKPFWQNILSLSIIAKNSLTRIFDGNSLSFFTKHVTACYCEKSKRQKSNFYFRGQNVRYRQNRAQAPR